MSPPPGPGTPPRAGLGAFASFLRTFPGAFTAAFAPALALHAWRLGEPLGRDQAIFYTLGRELLAGRVPYRDLFEHKPPGTILVYALAALVDGSSGVGPALLAALAVAATTGLLAAGLAAELGAGAAFTAAALYAASAQAPCFGGFWATAQPEVFQDLALALAAVVATRGRWSAAGAALAAALALKFTLVAALVPFAVWAWRAGRRRALGRLGAGIAVPSLALLALAAAVGALGPMWDAVIVFNLRHAQVHLEAAQVPEVLLGLGRMFVVVMPGLLLLPLLVARVRPWPRAGTLALALLGAALVQAVVQRKLWSWHFMPAVMPLAVLAALGLGRVPGKLAARAALALALLTTLAADAGEIADRHVVGSLTGSVPREAFLHGYRWGGDDFAADEIDAVGGFIASRAHPGDRLLVWGFEPGVYVRSGLRPGTRWLYDYPLTVALPPDARARAVDEVVAALPGVRWVVVFRNDANALEPEDSMTELRRLPALDAALHADYRSLGTVGDALVLERRAGAGPGVRPGL